MLRTNLATRPFYNERGVHVALVVAAVLVAALTVFNAIRIVSLSRQNTEFSTRISRDRSEAQRLNAEAAKIRGGINQDELNSTVVAAAEANRLIELRTFSWSAFFNRIEETLPADVMLTAVQPSFDQTVPVVVMTVLGRRTEDIDEFIGKLEATGAFSSVLPNQTDATDEGLHRVQLRAVYTGSVRPETPAEPADRNASPPSSATPGAATPGAAVDDVRRPSATVPQPQAREGAGR